MEAACCPLLSFGIEVEPKGKTVRSRLIGGKDAKSFLEPELGLLEKAD